MGALPLVLLPNCESFSYVSTFQKWIEIPKNSVHRPTEADTETRFRKDCPVSVLLARSEFSSILEHWAEFVKMTLYQKWQNDIHILMIPEGGFLRTLSLIQRRSTIFPNGRGVFLTVRWVFLRCSNLQSRMFLALCSQWPSVSEVLMRAGKT